MFIVYKKIISLIFFSSFLCSVSVYSGTGKSRLLSKNAFVRGDGPFWEINENEYKKFTDAGIALKNEFGNMIQFIKNQKIFVPESSNLGLSCKNNGESYRLKMCFSMDEVEDLQYLFKKSMGHIGARLTKSMLKSYKTELESMNLKLSAFHTETKDILSSLKLLSQPDFLCANTLDSSSMDTGSNFSQETKPQIDQIRKGNDVIEVRTSLPSNISLEVRLVGGKARDLTPHFDDNTVCVFSIDAQGVYESVQWTRNNRKKRYLENGKSYLWFGTAHDIFSSDVYDRLAACGVRKEDVAPLAHGVECKSSGISEDMPISLLLIVKKSESNKGYIMFPKTVENFQVSIGAVRGRAQDGLEKHKN